MSKSNHRHRAHPPGGTMNGAIDLTRLPSASPPAPPSGLTITTQEAFAQHLLLTQRPPTPQPRWQYRVIEWGGTETAVEFEQRLGELGAEAWDAVSVTETVELDGNRSVWVLLKRQDTGES